MSVDALRAAAIEAIFDEELRSVYFVLKGGTALRLLGIGSRGSLDLDFSMPEDLQAVDTVARRLEASLVRAFDRLGYEVFDFRFGAKPSARSAVQPAWWGGYECNFKVVPKSGLSIPLEEKRRTAAVIGPLQERKFRLQISKHEYCGSTSEIELQESTIRVYAPALIAAEKLRAICQQMQEYEHKGPKTPRARDFYDIHAVSTEASIDMTADDNVALVRRSFEAKRVAPALLTLLPRYREFHRPDWAAVEGSVAGTLMPFDFYFDFVTDLARRVERRLALTSANEV